MIRILIAHPSRLVCDSLRNILDKEYAISVTGCASTIEELNFLLPHADMILLGAEIEREDIFDLLQNIRLTHPHTQVLVVGVEDNPQMILQLIEAGVSGWISSSESLEEMVRKVVAARERKAFVSPAVAALMMERLAQLSRQSTFGIYNQGKSELVDTLTMREREILDLIGEGYTNKDIAQELIIEYGTVKNHVHNILRKLEANTRHEAVSLYLTVDYSQRALAA